jgi:acylphosphatase
VTEAVRRARVVVEGRVQGVWFRESCRREAVAAGVSGWVGNRSDGRVEAVFQGAPDAVARLIDWCRHGPARAVVTALQVTEEEPGPDEPGFRAR